MRVEINADNLFPVPGIASGMGYYKKFIGISKISAYGRLNYFSVKARENSHWINIKSALEKGFSVTG